MPDRHTLRRHALGHRGPRRREQLDAGRRRATAAAERGRVFDRAREQLLHGAHVAGVGPVPGERESSDEALVRVKGGRALERGFRHGARAQTKQAEGR
jgi:hypothetical protein